MTLLILSMCYYSIKPHPMLKLLNLRSNKSIQEQFVKIHNSYNALLYEPQFFLMLLQLHPRQLKGNKIQYHSSRHNRLVPTKYKNFDISQKIHSPFFH